MHGKMLACLGLHAQEWRLLLLSLVILGKSLSLFQVLLSLMYKAGWQLVVMRQRLNTKSPTET